MMNLLLQSLLESGNASKLLNEADDDSKKNKTPDTEDNQDDKTKKQDNTDDDTALDDDTEDTKDDDTEDNKDDTSDDDKNDEEESDDAESDDFSIDSEDDMTDDTEGGENPDGLPDPDDDGSTDDTEDDTETNLHVNILNLSKLDRVLAKRKCLSDFMELRANITTTRNMIDRTETLLDAEVRRIAIEKINLLSSAVNDYLKIKFKFTNYEENVQTYLLFTRYINEIIKYIKENWENMKKQE